MHKITQKIKALPKWTKIGVLGVVLMYLAIAGMTSAAIPWWIDKGDAALHLDYVLSVYHGNIPKYHDYIQYPVFHELDSGYKGQIQRAAANPPLFYILHAPIVGPLLQSRHWKEAIAVGRAINVFLGVLAVLALSWAGWLLGGKRKALFAVAVPAISSLAYQFTDLNQNYALDVLLVLIAVLTTITWYKLLEHGFAKRYLTSLLALSVLGMSTKATYIIFLGLSLLTIVIVAFLHGKDSWLKKLIRGSLISVLILASVVVAIGWFYYYWNYKVSGSWYSASLPGDSARPYKTLPTVINIHSELWSNFYTKITASPNLSIAITSSALVGNLWALSKFKLGKLLSDKPATIITGLLSLVLFGTTMTQISHAVGQGHIDFRYFLPSLLVFGLFISYGLLGVKRARGQFVSLAIAAMAVTSVFTIARLKDTKAMVPAVGETHNILVKLYVAIVSNGFLGIVLLLLLATLALGFGATAMALFKLSKSTTKTQKV